MGERLKNRYETQATLGRGTITSTHLALDHETGQRCVVKILSFQREDALKAHELLMREARVLQRLDHPCIPRFVDFFTEEGEPTRVCLVQQFVEGKSLSDLVASGQRFTAAEAFRVGAKLAGILEYLHGFDPPILHRDLKPANVLVSEGGRVVLVDFGAVRDRSRETPVLHQSGPTIVGTPGYMPIEQFEGRAVPASDLYSLGATLVFLLSGREPAAVDRRTLLQDVTPPPPEPARRFLRRLLEPDWRDRPGSAGEVRRELERLASAPSKPAWAARLPLSRKRALAAALAGASALGLVVWSLTGSDRMASPGAPRSTIAEGWEQHGVDARPWPARRTDAVGRALPAHARQRFGTVRLRHGGPVRAVGFASGHSLVASASEDGTASLWNGATGEELHRFDLLEPATAMAVSPGGSRLLVGTERFFSAWLLEAAGGPFARLHPFGADSDAAVLDVAWSRDGQLAATRTRASIDVWNARTGEHRTRVTGCGAGHGLAFLGDAGQTILVACQDGQARVIDAASGLDRRRLDTRAHGETLRVSPDERSLAAFGWSRVALFDLASGAQAGTLGDAETAANSITSGVFSPDGTSVVTGHRDGKVLLWELATRTRRRTVEAHAGAVTALAVSSDGQTLVTGGADHTIRLFDFATGKEKDQGARAGHSGTVHGLSFSPDGESLLSAGADGTLRRWTRRGGERMEKRFSAGATDVLALPNSRTLVLEQDRFHLLDATSGWEVSESPLPLPRRGVAVCPGRGLLAAGSASQLVVHDLEKGERRSFPLPRPEEPIAFSADGKLLATLRDEAQPLAGRPLVVRDATSGREISVTAHNRGGPFPTRCRSADGSLFGFNGGLWRLASGTRPSLENVAWPGRAGTCAVSPDGRWVALARDEPDTIVVSQRARVGKHVELRVVARLQGHRGKVASLAFSPDSHTLASGGTDGSIVLWGMNALESTEVEPGRRPAKAGRGKARLRLSFDGQVAGPGVVPLHWPRGERGMQLVPGRAGDALELERSLAFPETSAIVLGDEFTFEIGFRVDEAAVSAQGVHGVLSSHLLTLDVRDGGKAYLFFHFMHQGGHAQAELSRWIGRVEPDRWYRLGVSYRRAERVVRICVDGVCGPGPTDATLADRIGPLELGRRSYDRVSRVAVDELAVYDRARSDDEMARDAGFAAARQLPTPAPATAPTAAPVPAEALPVPREAVPEGRDVTAMVAVEERPHFTVHRFLDSIGRAQTLDLELGLGSVWVGTSLGLLRHDLRSGSWRHWNESAGLPGERLNEIAVVGQRVVTDTYTPTSPGSIRGTGVLAFDTVSRIWTPFETSAGIWDLRGDGDTLWMGLGQGAEMRDLARGTTLRFTRRAGQLQHDTVHSVRPHGSTVCFGMLGDWVAASRDFAGGGVTIWDRTTDRFRSYTERDGLARGYSCDIFVDEREVWVAHWDEERGLSRLDRRTGTWEKVRRSANGIDLGGVVLAGDADTLWIGQQGALVRLDRRSRQASALHEADGLPGYIVSGIGVAEDAVWASVYAYGGDGVRAAGVVRLPRKPR